MIPTPLQKIKFAIKLCALYVWLIWQKLCLVGRGNYNWYRNKSFFAPQLLRILTFDGKAMIHEAWIVWGYYKAGHGWTMQEPYIARCNKPLHELGRRMPPAKRIRRI